MKIECHRSGYDQPAARMLGAGLTWGNALGTEHGTAAGLRITLGLWWCLIFIWLDGPHDEHTSAEFTLPELKDKHEIVWTKADENPWKR